MIDRKRCDITTEWVFISEESIAVDIAIDGFFSDSVYKDSTNDVICVLPREKDLETWLLKTNGTILEFRFLLVNKAEVESLVLLEEKEINS